MGMIDLLDLGSLRNWLDLHLNLAGMKRLPKHILLTRLAEVGSHLENC